MARGHSSSLPAWPHELARAGSSRRAGVAIDPWTAAIGSLGLYTAAYVADVLRSGVFTVSKGQIEASLSLGFTYPTRFAGSSCPRRFAP